MAAPQGRIHRLPANFSPSYRAIRARAAGSAPLGPIYRHISLHDEMLTCEFCGTRMPQLPVKIEVVRETGPIGRPSDPRHGETVNFTRPYRFCSADHLYAWSREQQMMICNRQPTPFEDGMQPYLPSRHMGGRVGLCDGHHTGPHEWKEAWPG